MREIVYVREKRGRQEKKIRVFLRFFFFLENPEWNKREREKVREMAGDVCRSVRERAVERCNGRRLRGTTINERQASVRQWVKRHGLAAVLAASPPTPPKSIRSF